MNANIDSLNQEYAVQNHLIFKQLPGGIIVAQIDTPLATAIISLHGGQVVEWRPKHQETPVLWVSKLATVPVTGVSPASTSGQIVTVFPRVKPW